MRKDFITFSIVISGLLILTGILFIPYGASAALECSATSCVDKVIWSGCYGDTDKESCRTNDKGSCNSNGDCVKSDCTTTKNTCSDDYNGCSGVNACQNADITYSCDGSTCKQSITYTTEDSCGGCDTNFKCSSGSCVSSCVSTEGNSCTSDANTCGSTNSGTINCDGTCSASKPSNPYSGTACTSTANACGSTSGTTDVCTGKCTPPATPYSATACTSTPNNVGSTSGTTDVCTGKCTPPADVTLSVSVSTSPASGTAPLNGVKVTGDVSGTATGDIKYELDCTSDGTYEQTAEKKPDPYEFTTKCDYATAGSYTPKVKVTRQGLTATSTATVIVWGISLAADPSGNVTNTTSVTYTATSSSTIEGTPYYIRIYEGTTQVKNCTTGTTCSYSTSASNTKKSFVAKVENFTASTVVVTSSTVSTTWVPACDSTSYTACSTAKDFGSGGSIGAMCGTDQYYQAVVPAGKTCDVLFSVTPDSTADYDLYVKTTAAACPATNSSDCISVSGTGANDQCIRNLGPGTYKALVHKYSGTGSYAIASSVYNCKALAQCAAPQPKTPPCSYNSSANTLTFSWNAVTDAKSYFMEWTKWGSSYTFCLVPGCTPDSKTVNTTSGTTTSNLDKNTNYKLHVRAETSGSACATPGLFSADIECYTGTCPKTSTARNDSFMVPVQTTDGTKNCAVTATHSGRDYGSGGQSYDTNVSYQETTCQRDPATSSSNIQDVSCQTSLTTNSSTIAMDDDPVTACNNNLVFTNSFGISGTGALSAISQVSTKDAGHRLSFGYEFTTSQCVITGMQKNSNPTTTEMPDGSYVNPDGSGLSPVISADKKSASYQQAIYNNTSSTSQTSNFTFFLKECTQDSHCSAVTGKTYCNVSGGTRNVSAFPQNTCIDSIVPLTSKIKLIEDTTGQEPGFTPNLPRSGDYSAFLNASDSGNTKKTWRVSVSDSDNTGGSGLDVCYFSINDGTPKTRTCNGRLEFTVGEASTGADCTSEGNDACKIKVWAKDKVGNTTLEEKEIGRNATTFSVSFTGDERKYSDTTTYPSGFNVWSFGVDWTPPTAQ